MRILMLLNSYERDGPGNLVFALVSSMRFEPDVEIHTAALARSGVLREEYERLQIPTACFEMVSWFDWKVVNRVKDWMRERDFDVLHTHLLRPDLIGRVVSRFTKTPCVVSTEHGLHAWAEKGRMLEPFVATLYRQTLGFTDRIVAISDTVRSDLIEQKVDPERVVRIYNGIDVSVFVPITGERRDAMRALMCDQPGGRTYVGFVGNFIERKGAIHFIEALPRVIERNPEALPILVGEGEQEEALRGQVEALGLKGRVCFLGKLAEKLPELLASLDVLVVPSIEEPFGLIAAEAMACQVPVVAFDTGGLAEVVEHEETGLLVPPGSSEALADAVCRLLESDAPREEMGIAARNRVKENFDVELSAKQYLKLYNEVLEGKGIRGSGLGIRGKTGNRG